MKGPIPQWYRLQFAELGSRRRLSQLSPFSPPPSTAVWTRLRHMHTMMKTYIQAKQLPNKLFICASRQPLSRILVLNSHTTFCPKENAPFPPKKPDNCLSQRSCCTPQHPKHCLCEVLLVSLLRAADSQVYWVTT